MNRKRILGSRVFHLSSAVAWGLVDAYLGSNSRLHYDCMRPDLWIGPVGWIVFSVIPMIWMNMVFTHIFCSCSDRPLRRADKLSLGAVTKRGLFDRVCECSFWFLSAEYLSYAIQAKRLSYFYDYWKSALGIPFVGESILLGLPAAYVILASIFIFYEFCRICETIKFKRFQILQQQTHRQQR